MRSVLVASIGLLIAPPAWATVWEVHPGDNFATVVAGASAGDVIKIAPGWLPMGPPVLIDKDLTLATQSPGNLARLPALLVDGASVQLSEVKIVGSSVEVEQVSGLPQELYDTCATPAGAAGAPALCLVHGKVSGAGVVVPAPTAGGLRVGSGGEVDLEDLVVLGALSAPAVFLSDGSVVKIEGGRLTGATQGAVRVEDSELHLVGVLIKDNAGQAVDGSSGPGSGADLWMEGSTAELVECDLGVGPSTPQQVEGGSIYFSDSEVEVRDSRFVDYQASWGGVFAGEGGRLILRDCLFSGSNATEGGGVGWLVGVELTVEDSESVDTSAEQGGVWWMSGGSVESRRNRWENYQATDAGGALFLVDGTSLRSEGDIYQPHQDSRPENGGGIYAEGSVVALRSFDDGASHIAAVLAGHRVPGKGGFLFLQDGQLQIEDVDAEDNTAIDGGGFAWLQDTRSAWIHDSRFKHHYAGPDAGPEGAGSGVGGVFGTRGMQDLAFKRSSFCDSAAGLRGAVVSVEDWKGGRFEFYWNQVHYSYSDQGASITSGSLDVSTLVPGRAELVNNTFTQDMSSVATIGLHFTEVEVVNDIFAWQEENTAALWTVDEAPLSARYNLFFGVDPLGVGGAAGLLPGMGAVLDAPHFRDFHYEDTARCDQDWRLAPESPAVDAGDPSRWDEDGTRSDMGAYGGRGDAGAADVDADGDGYPASVDCDETRPQVHPGAPEVPDDGIDSDCDGYDPHTSLRAGGGCASSPLGPLSAGAPLLLLALVVGWGRKREDSL